MVKMNSSSSNLLGLSGYFHYSHLYTHMCIIIPLLYYLLGHSNNFGLARAYNFDLQIIEEEDLLNLNIYVVEDKRAQ